MRADTRKPPEMARCHRQALRHALSSTFACRLHRGISQNQSISNSNNKVATVVHTNYQINIFIGSKDT